MKENHFATNMDRLVGTLGQQHTLPTAHTAMTVAEAQALLWFSKAESQYKAKLMRDIRASERKKDITNNIHGGSNSNHSNQCSLEQQLQRQHQLAYEQLTQKMRTLIEQVGGAEKGSSSSHHTTCITLAHSSLICSLTPLTQVVLWNLVAAVLRMSYQHNNYYARSTNNFCQKLWLRVAD